MLSCHSRMISIRTWSLASYLTVQSCLLEPCELYLSCNILSYLTEPAGYMYPGGLTMSTTQRQWVEWCPHYQLANEKTAYTASWLRRRMLYRTKQVLQNHQHLSPSFPRCGHFIHTLFWDELSHSFKSCSIFDGLPRQSTQHDEEDQGHVKDLELAPWWISLV